jgi:hypothetical protein
MVEESAKEETAEEGSKLKTCFCWCLAFHNL